MRTLLRSSGLLPLATTQSFQHVAHTTRSSHILTGARIPSSRFQAQEASCYPSEIATRVMHTPGMAAVQPLQDQDLRIRIRSGRTSMHRDPSIMSFHPTPGWPRSYHVSPEPPNAPGSNGYGLEAG
ncbi:hypothetical protein C8Q77DRAFT_1114104 [Trametes polyzona]|nr:hypothetical protein C8Q77DRAFT_1114104 [Trametes polyzona]